MPKTSPKLTKSEEQKFSRIQASIEKLLTKTQTRKTGSKKRISPALKKALEEIVQACQNKNKTHLMNLLEVKSLICSQEIKGEPFWEDPKKSPVIYYILDVYSAKICIDLGYLPHGMASFGAKCPPTPSKEEQATSPTLRKIQKQKGKYQK